MHFDAVENVSANADSEQQMTRVNAQFASRRPATRLEIEAREPAVRQPRRKLHGG
jgi:hypothetical protein